MAYGRLIFFPSANAVPALSAALQARLLPNTLVTTEQKVIKSGSAWLGSSVLGSPLGARQAFALFPTFCRARQV